MTADEISWRLDQIVAVIVNLFARWPESAMSEAASLDLLDRLVAFLGPGLRAPPTTASSPG